MNENNQQITKKDLVDLGKGIERNIEKNFDKKLDGMEKRLDKGFDEKLGKFTDDVLLPAIEDVVKTEVKSEIGKHRHEMKVYIDAKLAQNKGDIISYIKGDQERDISWKTKVVEILKSKKLAEQPDLELLENLIR